MTIPAQTIKTADISASRLAALPALLHEFHCYCVTLSDLQVTQNIVHAGVTDKFAEGMFILSDGQLTLEK